MNAILGVVERCLRLDSYATRIYQMLALNAPEERLRSYWQKLADRNELHVLYWNQLSTWAANGLFAGLFESVDSVSAELGEIESKIKELAARCEGANEREKAFTLAFKLEFYLLHPAFETFYQYYRGVTQGDADTAPYERHISHLFEALVEYNLTTLELELVGETLHRLWQANRNLAILNNTDELTRVFNRRGLFNAVNHLAHLAQRNVNAVGVLMVDIDLFKLVNEVYGYRRGDELLAFIASAIRKNIRASDVVGRYGGEEFLVFLTKVDALALKEVGEKMRRAIVKGDGLLPVVTVSIGGASGHVHQNVDQGVQLLIQIAERRLARAKKEGRNCVII